MSATADAFRARIKRLREKFEGRCDRVTDSLKKIVKEAPEQLERAEKLLESRDPATRTEIRMLLAQLELAAKLLEHLEKPEQ